MKNSKDPWLTWKHAAGTTVKDVREVVRGAATPKLMSEPNIVALRKRPKNH